jgi:hypothetical protein
MPNLTAKFYEETGKIRTNQYIETGAYHGDGVLNVLLQYDIVHSIELSQVWYDFCTDRFKDEPKVRMYHGNSKYLLPQVLTNIHEPVTVYLDGHFSAGETAFGEEAIGGVSSNPLLVELEILMSRPYNDIIIIDDCRMIGKKDWINKGTTDGMWPEYEYDWTNITEQKILDMLKPGYVLIKNDLRLYSDGADDQWILVFKS